MVVDLLRKETVLQPSPEAREVGAGVFVGVDLRGELAPDF
jgi:hypothetical protein